MYQLLGAERRKPHITQPGAEAPGESGEGGQAGEFLGGEAVDILELLTTIYIYISSYKMIYNDIHIRYYIYILYDIYI